MDRKPQVRVTEWEVSIFPWDMLEDPSTDVWAWSIRIVYRGGDLWSVERTGFQLNHDGTWDVSLRHGDDEYLKQHRFSFREAFRAAQKAAPNVTINGTTATEFLARITSQDPGH